MPPPAQPPLPHTHLKPDDAARAPLQVLVHLHAQSLSFAQEKYSH